MGDGITGWRSFRWGQEEEDGDGMEAGEGDAACSGGVN